MDVEQFIFDEDEFEPFEKFASKKSKTVVKQKVDKDISIQKAKREKERHKKAAIKETNSNL